MIQMWGKTDTGLVRRENQDAYAMERDISGHAACIVCDGMGGPAGGQQASQIAVKTSLRELERLLTPDMTPKALQKASQEAVLRANQAIRDEAARNVQYAYMGTTLVSAISSPDGAVITNVGDSRAYFFFRGRLTQITRDHSLVQSMVDRGEITPEEARGHPKRNLITRALGPDDIVRCDIFHLSMSPDSWLLLCTDGLTNTVRDEEIREIFQLGQAEAILEHLFQSAINHGAPDNVTAVLMYWPPEEEAS